MASEHEKTEAVSEFLAKREVHDQWEDAYRGAANERFYERAFDLVAEWFGDPAGERVLDVGCGPGFHSMRLARRGFKVLGCDFSPPILELARANVEAAGLADSIELASENILELSFADGSQRRILCWGVLMHIPDVELAVAELSRVLAPGGQIVLSENNAHSLQSRANRVLGTLRRRPRAKRTLAGVEHWQERESGTLLTREADIGWLVDEFGKYAVSARERVACQFTEAYTKAPGRAAENAIHRINDIWFRRLRFAGPAGGNLLLLEKAG